MPFDCFRETFFVFDDYFDRSVVDRLEQYGMICHQLRFPTPPASVDALKRARWENCHQLVEMVQALVKNFHGNVHIYGQDHCTVSHILWEQRVCKVPFTLLEDGVANYRTKASLRNQFGEMSSMLPYLSSEEMLFGHNSRANDILLTGLWKIPEDLKSRVKIMDLKELWNRKSQIEKNFLLNIYHISMERVQQVAERPVCLLTSHLSREGIMSPEDELRLYGKMFEGISPEEVFIKLHPLFDLKKQFQEKFPELFIFDDLIPFEILYCLIGHHLKKILSLEFSTACAIASENIDVQIWRRDGTRIELPSYWQDFV